MSCTQSNTTLAPIDNLNSGSESSTRLENKAQKDNDLNGHVCSEISTKWFNGKHQYIDCQCLVIQNQLNNVRQIVSHFQIKGVSRNIVNLCQNTAVHLFWIEGIHNSGDLN